MPREHTKIPNVRNWAVRDYGNRIGIWRIMEVLTRYGIRASAALNSEVCDHHTEIIEEAGRLGWELIGHNETNALRLTEMDGAQERDAVRATIDRIDAASGDHRLLRRRGIRGEAPRLVPRDPGPRVRQAEADQHRGKV
jgi:peptidoglycan/xylan/chitin deacetylase (PgdA/CDA1 family)